MFPWLRLFRIAFTLIGRPQVDLLAITRVRMRVWPNDLDLNFHVNNGRYLALADIGRMHWFVRTRVLNIARKERAFPIVGDAIAKFRRDLKVFQKFTVESRLVGWDHKWGFLEHRFIRGGRVIGVVAVRGVFKGPDGPVDPNLFLAGLGRQLDSPPLPAWANEFQSSCESMSKTLREEERNGKGRDAENAEINNK